MPMMSQSDSDSDSSSSSSGISERSGSMSDHGTAPTPGHGIMGSDQDESPGRPKPQSPSDRSRSVTPASGSPHSQRSRSPSKSRSPETRARSASSERSKSPQSEGSRKSRSSYSGSPARSDRSASAEPAKGSRSSSRGSSKSRSPSPKSQPSGSSAASSRSNSPEKESSPKSHRSRGSPANSGSPASRGSQPSSPGSPRSPDKSKDDDSEKELFIEEKHDDKEKDVSGSDLSREGSPEKGTKRKYALASDESGDEGKEGTTAEALFGDADDISSDEDKDKGKSPKSDNEDERRMDVEERSDEEGGEKEQKEEEREEEPPETRIDVEIPKITFDCGRDIHFVKLPNFLSVDTRSFSADTYEDEIDEEETLDEEGRARLKLKVENTIRWREALDKEGNTIKESNARFVKWSDGSMSLHLGSEIFDVYKQPLQGDHNHLFVRQGTGLQGQAVFRTKLTFRPHSTESFTHRKMTLSLADRSQKSTGIKVLSQVGHDPDAHRGEMIKKEEEKLRALLRRESKAKRVRERGAGRNLNASYLEPDREDGSDDDGAISLNAIKDKFKAKGKHENKQTSIYSSEDDDSDLESSRKRRVDKVRALRDSDDDEEEGSQDDGKTS